ncbi:hypothetical protein K470DRAFT_259097 [Piedraia hortae CBS 480.64]|uniref:TrmE-type G domain-containing protein n=1 Tax=Piedraia hortae CBS 480.64 TaxID=1314780 RepID=A0A6A7BVI1_9PEZI|nr:hypothetical protein K470DRAFT_259097 [Piedraia hortae CBS 480.64]
MRRAIPLRQAAKTAYRVLGRRPYIHVQSLCRPIIRALSPQKLPRSIHHAAAEEETIYALSTAPGRAAIAIIRISGPAALSVYHILTRRTQPPKPRHATHVQLYSPAGDTQLLDPSTLALYFPSPRSSTGEAILELHIHGGVATTRAVLSTLSTLPSLRPASAGEFTRRAFYNNLLTLPEVESLSAALVAETEMQRRIATRSLKRTEQPTFEKWRKTLLTLRAELEAEIDFSEDHVLSTLHINPQVKNLIALLRQYIANAKRGSLLQTGVTVSILGPPNAGKSSLLNALAGREAAIVSPLPGTTRDVVELSLDLGGYPVRISDTAGVRSADGEVEGEGIRRAKERARDADLVVLVLAFGEGGELTFPPEVVEEVRGRANVIVVVNKSDLVDDTAVARAKGAVRNVLLDVEVVPISCKNGDLEELTRGLVQMCTGLTAALVGGDGEDPSIWEEALGASERQRVLLEECVGHLEGVLESSDVVVRAELVRFAAECLGKVMGRGDAGDVHEMLGVVFERFCVGK